ncbi:HutP family protein [Eubacteriales bacterium OttesenSCG-928-N14]|nr:HutP family protein [Eubacteriales bacterium OttesenSCG-928-N14]
MDDFYIGTSAEAAKAAIKLALTANRDEEKTQKDGLNATGIRACAVDFGGDFISNQGKMIERAVVAAKREGVIDDIHHEIGCVAGATREALSQIAPKAMGFSVGGKMGIARSGEHLSVCIFCGVGLLHLNEVSIGLGHRAI